MSLKMYSRRESEGKVIVDPGEQAVTAELKRMCVRLAAEGLVVGESGDIRWFGGGRMVERRIRRVTPEMRVMRCWSWWKTAAGRERTGREWL